MIQTMKKKTMKKRYTKRQITEAIAYWKKQLVKIDESFKGHRYSKDELLKQYDISIYSKKGVFRVDLDGIDPENVQAQDDQPYANAVVQSILDALEEVNYGHAKDSLVWLEKIEFTGIAGARVTFCSTSEDALVDFLNEWFIVRK